MNQFLLLCLTLLLSACASTPPPPDWQANAFAALNNYTAAYLTGNTRVADFEFARAKTDIASTGRTDLMVRAELVRCATQVASLVFQPCTTYQVLAADAALPERAYATFISGRWTGLEPAQLPLAYRALVAQALAEAPGDEATRAAGLSLQLRQIQDPLSRLVAAGALLQKEQLAIDVIELAVDTASAQGWRRPLLGWLGVQLKRHQTIGNAAAAQQIRRRIDLVLQAPAG